MPYYKHLHSRWKWLLIRQIVSEDGFWNYWWVPEFTVTHNRCHCTSCLSVMWCSGQEAANTDFVGFKFYFSYNSNFANSTKSSHQKVFHKNRYSAEKCSTMLLTCKYGQNTWKKLPCRSSFLVNLRKTVSKVCNISRPPALIHTLISAQLWTLNW